MGSVTGGTRAAPPRPAGTRSTPALHCTVRKSPHLNTAVLPFVLNRLFSTKNIHRKIRNLRASVSTVTQDSPEQVVD